MTLTREDWLKAQAAWENVKRQAEIDLEQAELYLKAVRKKINSIPKPEEIGSPNN